MSTHLVLVEDDPVLRSLLKTLLELEGYSVMANELFDPQNFIAELEAERPDAIIMDVHFKNTNTIQTVQQINRLWQENRPKIIMTSGMNLQHECIAAGADFFVQKPFMPDELLAQLKESLPVVGSQE